MTFEAGTYRGQLKGAVCCEAKTGTLQLALKFDVAEHWNGTGWEGVATPGEHTVFVSLTDKAWPYSIAKLERLNFNGDFANPEFRLDPAGVDLMCSDESYNGKPTQRWELGGYGVAREQAATDKLKRLNSRWRATSRTPKRVTPTTKAPKPLATPTAPPAVPKPSSEPVRTSSRDQAWNTLCEMWSDRTEAELHERWAETIAERLIPEDKFTAEDWGRVEAALEIPF